MGPRNHGNLGSRVAEDQDYLNLGRGAYDGRQWHDTWRLLSLADEVAPLGVEDLERLAMAAYLAGRDEDYLRTLERAHHAYLDAGNCVRAARAAFWLGLRLAFRGETGPATGWFGRAARLLQREGKACVEEGYLLLPTAEQQLCAGAAETAYTTAARAAEIGDQFGESDLSACARHVQGRALIQEGQVEKGLALLDEAMVAVAAGELSPIMTGLIYCSVIDTCQQVYAVDRARQWTHSLARWCAEQPQLISFTGTCLVHRAEIMQMNGAWREAIEEARRACGVSREQPVPAAAYYQQAEVHRLRGEFAEAEEAYQQASRHGCEPLPGLALLRLAQGRTEPAAASISRALGATTDRLQRTKLLPACVEIMLVRGDLASAREMCRELEETADRFQTAALRAMAAQTAGAVALAEGDHQSALPALRRAFELWLQVEAPYLAARTRELIGLVCRSIGDKEGARLELAAAREAFATLGAVPDVARIDRPVPFSAALRGSGLTPRELEVLRLVATGKPNKVIASELGLSEKTIDRHLSNIFGKLGVSSRTAAAAWAYGRKLV